MVDIFESKMCNYCKSLNCEKKITVNNINGVTVYKCDEYIKDNKKIQTYTKPLVVTAERDYTKLQNREI